MPSDTWEHRPVFPTFFITDIKYRNPICSFRVTNLKLLAQQFAILVMIFAFS